MIQASFARPIGLFDNWFNRFVATLTGGSYCHSEFIFSWDIDEARVFVNALTGHQNLKNKLENESNEQVNICFYVVWGDRCGYRLLKHDENNMFYQMPNETEFSTVSLDMNTHEEKEIARFLFNQCGKEYDYTGALTYFFPLRTAQREYTTYFCSQLMVCGLQRISRLENINPASITPNKLYNLLLTSC
jgi:hypothetical protein